MACFAASKMDDEPYSAFIVFLPLIVTVMCCGCIIPAIVLLVGTSGNGPPTPAAQQKQEAPKQQPEKEQQQQQQKQEEQQKPQQHDTAPCPDSVGAPAATVIGSKPAIEGTAETTGTRVDGSVGVELATGCAVVIYGLTGATELNGQEGVCEAWDADRDRWSVRLSSGEVKALKPSNLRGWGSERLVFHRSIEAGLLRMS